MLHYTVVTEVKKMDDVAGDKFASAVDATVNTTCQQRNVLSSLSPQRHRAKQGTQPEQRATMRIEELILDGRLAIDKSQSLTSGFKSYPVRTTVSGKLPGPLQHAYSR